MKETDSIVRGDKEGDFFLNTIVIIRKRSFKMMIRIGRMDELAIYNAPCMQNNSRSIIKANNLKDLN